jgi:SHS family sialic acid transporter-like MFS transporter
VSEPESTRLTRAHWMVLAAAFMGWMFDGLEMGLFPLIARPALQDLLGVTDEAAIGLWNGRIAACFLLGAATGGLLFGWLGDKIGRVRAMLFSVLTYSLFTGLCFFAGEAWHLGGLRFLAALGMGGEWSLGVALVMEIWPEKLRPLMAGIIGAAANVGFLSIALLAMFIEVTVDSWRWVMIVGAAPALLTIFIRLFVPESERWQASVKKTASKPIKELCNTPTLWKPMFLGICFASIALIGTWGAVSGFLPLWADQLGGAENPFAKGTVQFCVSIGAIIGCLAGPLLGGKIGRRPAYFLLCLSSLIVCAVLFRVLTEYNAMFLFFCGLAGLTTASFYGWLPLYLPELFPTRVRATGQGLSFNFGRVAAAGAALGTGILMLYVDGSYPRACAIVSLVYIVGMVIIWLAPETKGKPLPD